MRLGDEAGARCSESSGDGARGEEGGMVGWRASGEVEESGSGAGWNGMGCEVGGLW